MGRARRESRQVPDAGRLSIGAPAHASNLPNTNGGSMQRHAPMPRLWQFHYLREAGHFIFEADRRAKNQLKKQVRGVRPIERQLGGRTDTEAAATRAYCLAVRSAPL